MDVPLTPREIRNIYKISRGIKSVDVHNVYQYINWLENLLANSNFNTIEEISKVIAFKNQCPVCEQLTYSKMHQVCKNSECFNYILKDPDIEGVNREC